MKRFLLVVAAGTFLSTVGVQTSSLAARQERVKLCHVTGDDANNHVIEVAAPAVPAHLGHGDSLEAAEGLEVGDPCVIEVVE